jgi:hypothetical protein
VSSTKNGGASLVDVEAMLGGKASVAFVEGAVESKADASDLETLRWVRTRVAPTPQVSHRHSWVNPAQQRLDVSPQGGRGGAPRGPARPGPAAGRAERSADGAAGPG